MKVKLRDGITIDTTKIKALRNKPVKLYVSLGKGTKVDYSIEWNNGMFSEISKQDYKRLIKILEGEPNNEYRRNR